MLTLNLHPPTYHFPAMDKSAGSRPSSQFTGVGRMEIHLQRSKLSGVDSGKVRPTVAVTEARRARATMLQRIVGSLKLRTVRAASGVTLPDPRLVATLVRLTPRLTSGLTSELGLDEIRASSKLRNALNPQHLKSDLDKLRATLEGNLRSANGKRIALQKLHNALHSLPAETRHQLYLNFVETTTEGHRNVVNSLRIQSSRAREMLDLLRQALPTVEGEVQASPKVLKSIEPEMNRASNPRKLETHRVTYMGKEFSLQLDSGFFADIRRSNFYLKANGVTTEILDRPAGTTTTRELEAADKRAIIERLLEHTQGNGRLVERFSVIGQQAVLAPFEVRMAMTRDLLPLPGRMERGGAPVARAPSPESQSFRTAYTFERHANGAHELFTEHGRQVESLTGLDGSRMHCQVSRSRFEIDVRVKFNHAARTEDNKSDVPKGLIPDVSLISANTRYSLKL